MVVLEQGPWLRERDFKHDELWANRRHALTNDPRPPAEHPPPDRGRDRDAAADRELRRVRRRRQRPLHGQLLAHSTSSTSSSGAGAARVAGTGLDDWPITYAELEPYYTKAEWELGVSGLRPAPHDPTAAEPAVSAAAAAARSRSACWPNGPRGSSAGPRTPSPMAILSQPYGGRARLRPVRLLRGLRLRDAGEEQHAGDGHSGRGAHRAVRDPARELRAGDRGRPPRPGDGRRVFRSATARSGASAPGPWWSAPTAPRRRGCS